MPLHYDLVWLARSYPPVYPSPRHGAPPEGANVYSNPAQGNPASPSGDPLGLAGPPSIKEEEAVSDNVGSTVAYDGLKSNIVQCLISNYAGPQ
jgi:hypothetical protein